MNPESKPPSKRSWRWAVWIPAICVLLSGGYLLSQRTSGGDATKNGGGGKKAKGFGPIPVATEKVKRGEMGAYINALGTVTPVYTVAITSRVGGQLMKIYYREGQIVHKGDLLAEIDSRPFNAIHQQARGQLERDEALLNNARRDLDRYQSAFAQHAIPEQTVMNQQSTVTQYEAATKLDRGTVNAAQVNLNYTRLTSPIDGRVGLRQIDPGNIIQANGTTPLVTVTQLQPITVIFTMAEDYIHDVAMQLRAGHKLTVDAFDRDNSTLLAKGVVLTLDNQIDPATGTVKIKAEFANRDMRLFPNEFVNARLLVRTLHDANIVPTATLQRNNEAAFVYVVNPESSSVNIRPVNVLATNGLEAAISGVQPGDTLVIDGFDKLQNNTKVVARTPEARHKK